MDLCYSCGTCRHLCNRSDRNVFKKHEEKPRSDARSARCNQSWSTHHVRGGIYGKIVKIKNDVIDVEINKSTVIQISRYSIQNVITD